MNAYFAELFGTALLILLGNGVVANVCLNKTKGQSSGWIVITTAWAFAVYVAVVVTGPYSGAHLNPAVTLGVAMKGAFAWELVPGYIAAQVVGGMVGALLVYILYKDHFAATEEEGLKRACFCTEPAIRNYPINLVNEIVGTFVTCLCDFLSCWSKYYLTRHSRKHANWFRFYRGITRSDFSLGNWIKFRWYNRLCDQSSPRILVHA